MKDVRPAADRLPVIAQSLTPRPPLPPATICYCYSNSTTVVMHSTTSTELIDGLISDINKLMMSKSSPWSQGRKIPSGRKIYNVVSMQKGKGDCKYNTPKKRHLKKKEKKEDKADNCYLLRVAVGAIACILKNDRTKGRGCNESKTDEMRNEMKQRKTGNMASANKNTRRVQIHDTCDCQLLWRANHTSTLALFGLSSPFGPSHHVCAYCCMS